MRKALALLALSLALTGPASAEYVGGYSFGIVPGAGGGGGTPSAILPIDVTASPYNAACNGSTNDTSAFNTALVAANAQGGGVVTAPDGRICTIQTGTSVALQSNTCIKGNFTLRGTSATNNTEMILAISKTNVCVKDVTIDMIDSFVNLNNSNAAISAFASDITIENVKIVNKGNMGVVINGGGTYRILNNNITMNAPYGSGHQNQAMLVSISGAVPTSGIIDGNVVVGSGLNLVTQNTQITNNKISGPRYGGGIGISSLAGGGINCDFNPCLGNIIAHNEVSGGVGIDDIGTIVLGIEIFDRRGIVIGNRVWNNAGEAIHGGAATIANNVAYDNCLYYTTNAAGGSPCSAFNTRKDIDDGSDTIWSGNRAYNSFGATLAVTGTQNVAGVIRILVASTTGVAVGSSNATAPCQVRNVGGTTNANNGWTQCKVIDATHIELTGSVFNSAWTSGGTIGGLQDYAYNETSAALTGVQLVGNSFGPGFLGTTNIINASTGLNVQNRAVVTGANTNALAVGRQGTTSPAFQVDSNAGSSATGVKITSAAAGGAVVIGALSSGTDESLVVNAKGTGSIQIAQSSTGPIALNRDTVVTGTETITAQNTAALAVGRQGATNPALLVDSNAASSVTGVRVSGLAAGGGAGLAAISSGTNESLFIDAKGTGGITMGTASTGVITNQRATTIASNSTAALAVGANGATNPAFQIDSSAASVATGLRINAQAAAGGVNLTTQSTGTNENFSLNSKGSGALSFNDVATGNLFFNRIGLTNLGFQAISGANGVPIQGSSTNFAVAAGNVGQKIQCTPVTSGSPVNLVNNTPKDLCSMTLTAGNWMVWCNPIFKTTATTTVSYITSSISTASLTIQTGVGQYASQIQATAGVANSTLLNIGMPMGAYYTSLAGSTNHFCVVQGGFGVSTMDAYGGMWAIRAP